MQINNSGKGIFEIKTKEAKIELFESVKVDAFEFKGPGEFEKSGIFVEGISDNGNTLYKIKAEEINLCYLGRLSHDLREEEAKEIGDIDILFLPLGEDGTVEADKAISIASSIDPKIVIPMYYKDLSEFKKSEGITDGETDLFKIKKSDLPETESWNIILKSS